MSHPFSSFHHVNTVTWDQKTTKWCFLYPHLPWHIIRRVGTVLLFLFRHQLLLFQNPLLLLLLGLAESSVKVIAPHQFFIKHRKNYTTTSLFWYSCWLGWVDSVSKALHKQSQVTAGSEGLQNLAFFILQVTSDFCCLGFARFDKHTSRIFIQSERRKFVANIVRNLVLLIKNALRLKSYQKSSITGTRTSVKGQSLRVTSLASFWYLINVRRVAFALRSAGALEACMPGGESGTLDYPSSLCDWIEKYWRFYFCHSILFKLLSRPFTGLKSLHNSRTRDLSRNMVIVIQKISCRYSEDVPGYQCKWLLVVKDHKFGPFFLWLGPQFWATGLLSSCTTNLRAPIIESDLISLRNGILGMLHWPACLSMSLPIPPQPS